MNGEEFESNFVSKKLIYVTQVGELNAEFSYYYTMFSVTGEWKEILATANQESEDSEWELFIYHEQIDKYLSAGTSTGNEFRRKLYAGVKYKIVHTVKSDCSLDGETSEEFIEFSSGGGGAIWDLKSQFVNDLTDELELFPNPVKDELSLSYSLEGNKEVKIYSANGQIVKTSDFIGQECKIDVSNLETGLYLVRVVSENGFIATKKFVK